MALDAWDDLIADIIREAHSDVVEGLGFAERRLYLKQLHRDPDDIKRRIQAL